MHRLYFSADCFRGFIDGEPIQGLFYLHGPAPTDFPERERADLFESAWSGQRERTKTIASVEALIVRAHEPGDDAEVLTLILPLHDETTHQDRFNPQVMAYFEGETQGVITRQLLVRRQDLREFAGLAVQSQVYDTIGKLLNPQATSAAQILHRALALRTSVKKLTEDGAP